MYCSTVRVVDENSVMNTVARVNTGTIRVSDETAYIVTTARRQKTNLEPLIAATCPRTDRERPPQPALSVPVHGERSELRPAAAPPPGHVRRTLYTAVVVAQLLLLLYENRS